MFGLSVLLAVFALAGAPASTPASCNPSLTDASGIWGQTWQYPDGTPAVVNGTTIMLGPTACVALLYASESAKVRAQIRRLNPGIDFDRMLGVGLQIALHESEHVALRSRNECFVQKTARTKINRLIERYADPGHALSAEAAATASDASLPAIYHDC